MKKVFSKPSELEKIAKATYEIPDFLMMENAASAMADLILQLIEERKIIMPKILILCGKGNNGGDGYAVARMLADKTEIQIIALETPASMEAIAQAKICDALGIIQNSFDSFDSFNLSEFDFIVDCIYGTGFHGQLSDKIKTLFEKINETDTIKIACDIPSGLAFNADYTVTMGEHKTCLYSDKAKAVCGSIIVAQLGIPTDAFEAGMEPDAFLLEKQDAKLPFRINKSAHKGTYGHTTVFAGEKSGASILAATSAMNFGSGLTTLLTLKDSNLIQFQISPELMISSSIPEKTTCVIFGPGLDLSNKNSSDENESIKILKNWFTTTKTPSAVLDAGAFSYENLVPLLEDFNKIENAKLILTPHLFELSKFLKLVKAYYPDVDFSEEEISVGTLANNPEIKIKIGKILNKLFPQTAVIMKSANTFIASENRIYIFADGAQSLAKGGSGDVLAGMAGSLLAQGYNCTNAAITATQAHGIGAVEFGSDAFDLTPLKLIFR